jgi:type VI secretion system secreted protein Hcp
VGGAWRRTSENCFVTSVSQGGSGGEDRFTETVSLVFEQIMWTYTAEDGRKVTGGWDVVGIHRCRA